MASKKAADDKPADPVVKTSSADTDADVRSAPAIKDAADSAYDKQYRENPDKPASDSVAQLEVLPSDK